MNKLNHLVLALLLLSTFSQAAVIDFEMVPGGTPSDKLAISTQYLSTYGVRFGLDTNGDRYIDSGQTPFLEMAGAADTGNGFLNDQVGTYDMTAPGRERNLGNYFLRLGTGGLEQAPAPVLLIGYAAPVSAASAQIWDIDGHANGNEQWLVSALDINRNVIDTRLSPLGVNHGPNSLDGLPWRWIFNHGTTTDIYGISIEFVGTKTSGIGLAFDNFSPATVPLPGALWLFISACICLVGLKFKK